MADPAQTTGRNYSLIYVAAAALAGLVLGILIAWAFVVGRSGSPAADDLTIPNLEFTTAWGGLSTSTAPTSTPPAGSIAAGSESLSVADQAAGMVVVIARASVTEAQWVVVHESRAGRLGNVLGAARFVGGATEGAVELLRGTQAGSTYYAVIYADNGDRQFSLALDTPLTDVSGTPKAVSFRAN